jgi:hypothetical protein
MSATTSAFGTPPPPAVAYQPTKNAKLHDNITDTVTKIRNELFKRGVCRVQPYVEDLQTSSVAYFPVGVAVAVGDDLLDDLRALETRAKFELLTHADRVCPEIKIQGCLAVIVTMPHLKYKDPTEDVVVEPTPSWSPRTRMLVVFLLILAVGVCIGLFTMKIPKLIGF